MALMTFCIFFQEFCGYANFDCPTLDDFIACDTDGNGEISLGEAEACALQTNWP